MNYSMRSTLKNSFVLDTGLIVPGIVEAINDCMEKSSMTIEEVEIEFMQLERRNIPTPLTVSKSWNRFMKEYKQLIK